VGGLWVQFFGKWWAQYEQCLRWTEHKIQRCLNLWARKKEFKVSIRNSFPMLWVSPRAHTGHSQFSLMFSVQIQFFMLPANYEPITFITSFWVIGLQSFYCSFCWFHHGFQICAQLGEFMVAIWTDFVGLLLVTDGWNFRFLWLSRVAVS